MRAASPTVRRQGGIGARSDACARANTAQAHIHTASAFLVMQDARSDTARLL